MFRKSSDWPVHHAGIGDYLVKGQEKPCTKEKFSPMNFLRENFLIFVVTGLLVALESTIDWDHAIGVKVPKYVHSQQK